jgi:hypothetical protein
MNITDLIFQYRIDIEHDGDFDGGCYYVTLNYEAATQQGSGEVQTKIILKQDDINEMYEGALKLTKELKKYIHGGY